MSCPVVVEIDLAQPLVIEVGIPGPPGPTGPEGPQGPAGPTAGQLTLTAGEDIALGELVAVDSSGEAVLSNCLYSSGNWRVVGVALEAASTSEVFDVQASAGAIVPVLFGSAPAAASNGQWVFLDDTAGQATLVPPLTSGRTRQIVGILQGADGASTTPGVLLMPQYLSRKP